MRWGATLLPVLASCQLVFDVDVPGPAPLGTCSRADTFADDFDTGTLSPIWRPTTSDEANSLGLEDGAENVLSFMLATASENILETVPFFDMRGSTISVDVTTAGSFGTAFPDAVVALDLQEPGFVWNATAALVQGNAVVLRKIGGDMEVARWQDGNFASVRNIAMVETPKVWRISHDGSEMIFETSADGETFDELQRIERDIGMVRPRLYTKQGTGGSFSARFDRFNGGGEATGEVCAMELLVDTFDSELDRNIWSETATAYCTTTIEDGKLVWTAGPGVAANECLIRTGAFYDLHRGSIAVEVDAAPDIGHSLRARISTLTDTAEIAITANSATTNVFARGSRIEPAQSYGEQPYSSDHRWLRLRAEITEQGAEQLIWETSPDGITYTELGLSGDYVGLDRVRFEVRVDGPQTDPGRFEVFGVNVPP
jgi:hypothetical protein